MSAPTLLAAALTVPHDHSRLRHGQTGNPFYDWWGKGQFACVLCLAIMREQGEDIALKFALGLPYEVGAIQGDRLWWSGAYLTTLRFVPDPLDREYMREQLAEALRRGKAEAARVRAKWLSEQSAEAAS